MILGILFRGNVDFSRDLLLAEFTKTVRSNLFECTIYPAVCIPFFLLNVILYYVISFYLFSVTISHTTTSRRSFGYVAPKDDYIIWLVNISVVHVPDEGYFRNASCALSYIFTLCVVSCR
jgi:hypothetical protein